MAQVPRDIAEFLREYPDQDDDLSEKRNLLFYQVRLTSSTSHVLTSKQNTHRCQPDGLLIDELHERWEGKFDILEAKHGYIQWLQVHKVLHHIA